MKVLDLDLDYFMDSVATFIEDSSSERLDEEYYGDAVWSEARVRNFLEINLGLSKQHKIPGRVVVGHNESLLYWREMVAKGHLTTPFEVVHVDSHADLGLGYSSWSYITKELLQFPVSERPVHNRYIDCYDKERIEGIGDYLLFAIAYRWIDKLTYCANPNGEKNDYLWTTLKDFNENFIWDTPVRNDIQLVCNPVEDFPEYDDSEKKKIGFLERSKKEPVVPMLIIPTVENVNYDGCFDFAVMAQSPNYTPASADFILDIFREYIEER